MLTRQTVVAFQNFLLQIAFTLIGYFLFGKRTLGVFKLYNFPISDDEILVVL